MKGDFARVSFDPTLHYSQVFQQQGRVLLEADWNEQAHIQLHLLRTLVRDLVGPCWAAGSGFGITSTTTNADGSSKPLPLTDWQLAPGHFYVDGILCVNEAACTLVAQPQGPTPDYGVADGRSGFENPPAGFVLWLDVWERHVSAVEASALADVALDGVDTTSRAQVVWQLRALDRARADQRLDDITAALKTRQKASTGAADVAAIKQQLVDVGNLRSGIDGQGNANMSRCTWLRQLLGARVLYALPRMRAELGPVEPDGDPCVIAADARYRGCENQLYRVEIHQGGLAGTATFKWSRENGSVVFPITRSVSGAAADDGSTQQVVTLGRLGRDARLGLAVNDWVELVDDAYTLGQRAFPLLQVIAVDVANCSVTLNVPKNLTPWHPGSDPRQHALLRRWDQVDAVTTQGVLTLGEGAPIVLEDGIQVTFEPGGVYATGEYWLIPARVAGNGQIDWPLVTLADGSTGAPAALPPRGLHHYAALGVTDDKGAYQECCCRFESLCSLMQAGANKHPSGGMNFVMKPQASVAKATPIAKNAGKVAKAAKTTRAAKKARPG
ncbi:DUF6519 domain-containing protein [Rhodanobacter sp. T12-5]|uniref:DUF6519 domain-containing protein n=1 Tax=Rhodanobacter sp. T12-5 TaxID=2024611 RepID=UPI0011ECD652|nr:DUF6519 domain-containing protein [Rhodanobacter sp. T12-5]KAA0068655.1 hypothetical protein CIW53_15390 [Rhodanobacter sp. T12-5]